MKRFGMVAAALVILVGSARAKDVPIQGTISGVAVIEYGETVKDPLNDLFIPVESSGEGSISNIGPVTLMETHETIILASAGYQKTLVLDGEATLTTSSGDQIHLIFGGTGVATANGFDDTFVFLVVGGTGRYRGATGSGTILSSDQGVSKPFVDARGHLVETAPFVFTLNGVISKVGS